MARVWLPMASTQRPWFQTPGVPGSVLLRKSPPGPLQKSPMWSWFDRATWLDVPEPPKATLRVALPAADPPVSPVPAVTPVMSPVGAVVWVVPSANRMPPALRPIAGPPLVFSKNPPNPAVEAAWPWTPRVGPEAAVVKPKTPSPAVESDSPTTPWLAPLVAPATPKRPCPSGADVTPNTPTATPTVDVASPVTPAPS